MLEEFAGKKDTICQRLIDKITFYGNLGNQDHMAMPESSV